MPTAIHLTTLELRYSKNRADADAAQWSYQDPPPGPQRYWVADAGVVREMDAAEKVAADAAIAAALVTANRGEATVTVDEMQEAIGWTARALIELLNKRDNFNTTRLIEIQGVMSDIRDQTLGTQARQNIPAGFPMATNTRARPAAVQDYKDIIASGGADS